MRTISHMLISRESSSDIEAIDEMHREAFATPVEAKLVHALRADAGWVPALSLVAGIRRRVVGHVVCTEGTLGEETVLGLGPLGVRSESQRHGIGSALMHAVLGAAAALDYPMVCLLGEPAYYRRFGFVTGSDVGVVPEVAEWGTYFQVRVFRETAPGPFHYAEPFRQL